MGFMKAMSRYSDRVRDFWTGTMFTDRDVCPAAVDRRGHFARGAALFLLAFVLFFSRLDAPLLEPEEARYAEIPRQMLVHGSFSVPLLHGEAYYHKPPLMYWLVMASYQVFDVHDWAARLVPGMLGVLTVLLVYFWGTPILGSRAAFLSAVVLCLCPRFLYQGRMLTLDCLLSLCVLGALLAAYRSLHQGRIDRKWWLAAAVWCGLGILTKGPVAAVLIVVPVLMLQFLDRRVGRLTIASWAVFFAVAGTICVSWYVSLFYQDVNAAVDFFWFHNVVRFVEPFDHAKPFWYYAPGFFLGTLPWSLLLVPLLRSLSSLKNSRPAVQGFFFLALVWCFGFFSCSGCKRAIYLLPALPMLAIVLGCYLDRVVVWRAESGWLPLPANRARWAAVCFGGLAYAGLHLGWVPVAADLWDWQEGLWFSLALAVMVLAAVWTSRKKSPAMLWGWNVLLLFGLCWAGIGLLLPDYNRRFSLRGSVQRYQDLCRAENLGVAVYPRLWDSLSFYLQADAVEWFAEDAEGDLFTRLGQKSATLVVIQNGAPLQRFLAQLPAGLEFVPLPRQRNKVTVGIVKKRVADHGGS
jgi:4-amino-4-deoxy-L-arabinose transferase-like glycosyltransferase